MDGHCHPRTHSPEGSPAQRNTTINATQASRRVGESRVRPTHQFRVGLLFVQDHDDFIHCSSRRATHHPALRAQHSASRRDSVFAGWRKACGVARGRAKTPCTSVGHLRTSATAVGPLYLSTLFLNHFYLVNSTFVQQLLEERNNLEFSPCLACVSKNALKGRSRHGAIENKLPHKYPIQPVSMHPLPGCTSYYSPLHARGGGEPSGAEGIFWERPPDPGVG